MKRATEYIFRNSRWRRGTDAQLHQIESALQNLQPLIGYLPVLDALGAQLGTLDALGVRLATLDALGARVSLIDEMAHSLQELHDAREFHRLVAIVKPAIESYLSDNHEIAENVRTDVEALTVMTSSLQMQLNRLEAVLKNISIK